MSLTGVAVTGDGRSMGRAYGEGCAEPIAASLAFYERFARERGSLAEIQRRTGPFVDAARAGVPELAAEVDGLAEGAHIETEAAWFLNCMEEVWPFESCTTMVSERWLMHAEQWYAGHSAIAVVAARPSSGPAFVSPTCAGFLPAVGLNASGFAQGIDSLTARDERVGIPRLLVSRLGLGAEGIEAAAATAVVEGRAGGYAHVLATAGRRLVVETTATASARLPGGRLHTNHVVSPALKEIAPGASEGSLARLSRARELVRQSRPRTAEDCMTLLADHASSPQSICLHDDPADPTASATVFGMVCDLETGDVFVSDGRPCAGRWHEYRVPAFVPEGVAHVG